jgi:uncharacterized protein YjbI with pentapeptide repeats
MKLSSLLIHSLKNSSYIFVLSIIFLKTTFAFNNQHEEKFSEALSQLNMKLEKKEAIDYPNLMNFSNMDLSNIHRKKIIIHAANFQSTNLSNTDFYGSDLSNASFVNANLTNSNLSYCLLQNIDLTNAIIENTNFTYSILIDAKGIDSEKCGILDNFKGAVFDESDLSPEIIRSFSVKLHGASPVVSVCYKQACPLFEKQKHLKSS